MKNFKIVPISKSSIEKIKSKGEDEFGNLLIEEMATGHGPCRISLKPFRPGVDKRLLFLHSPFDIHNAFNQPGPVFVSASDDVEEYRDIYRFPIEIKNGKEQFPLTLIGYSS